MHPSYQQLYDIPKSFAAEVDFGEIYKDNDWLPKLAKLKKIIHPKEPYVKELS